MVGTFVPQPERGQALGADHPCTYAVGAALLNIPPATFEYAEVVPGRDMIHVVGRGWSALLVHEPDGPGPPGTEGP